ncbi:MAG: hypothetical protein CK517_00250 [Flavobacteriales bacterium]|nr:MAG: hypothetical protein CK517_00250 [Flavobacteriales bacterium]
MEKCNLKNLIKFVNLNLFQIPKYRIKKILKQVQNDKKQKNPAKIIFAGFLFSILYFLKKLKLS